MRKYLLPALITPVLVLPMLAVAAVAVWYPSSELDAGAARAEVFDPATGRWSPTGPLAYPRSSPVLTLQPDGTVRASDGRDGWGDNPDEVFDPANNTWRALPDKTRAPDPPQAPEGAEGAVVYPGGAVAFTPPGEPPVHAWFLEGSAWRPAADPPHGLHASLATALPDGRVAVLGTDESTTPQGMLAAAGGTAWSALPAPPGEGTYGALSATPDGRLYYARDSADPSGMAFTLEPGAAAWRALPSPAHVLQLPTLAPLRGGRVLLAGGTTHQHILPSRVALRVVAALAALGLLALGIQLLRRKKPPALGVIAGLVLSAMLGFAAFFVLLIVAGGVGHGRPLRARGRALRARVRRRAGGARVASGRGGVWSRALGELWRSDAAMESASVAAFERLALDLSAHGAPAALCARARDAAQEEAGHARQCLALAGAHLGGEWVAEMPSIAHGESAPSLATLAVESLVDGCLGEGVAAATAGEALASVGAGPERDALGSIARDEASHAALSWDVLAFCVTAGGAPVADAVREAIAREVEGVRTRAWAWSLWPAAVLRAGGRLPARRMASLDGSVRSQVARRAREILAHHAVPALD